MSQDRYSELLEALINGETTDIVPRSRVEKILKNCIDQKGDEGCSPPQSRAEAYLQALALKLKNGGGGSGGGDEQSVLDSLIDGSITEVTSNATAVKGNIFVNCNNLTSANFPLATEIGTYAFSGCSSLTSANFPSTTLVSNYAFRECSSLTSANFPLATEIRTYVFRGCSSLTSANFPLLTSIGSSAFEGCSSLTTVDFPLLTSIGGSAFEGCSSLTTVDFPLATSIGAAAFIRCYRLKAVVLRSDSICNLSNTTVFNNCYHFYGTVNATYNPEGLKDGYFYVPRKWLSDDDETKDYRRATNWSTFDTTQFRALEDYTVDGTTTGALDLTKI